VHPLEKFRWAPWPGERRAKPRSATESTLGAKRSQFRGGDERRGSVREPRRGRERFGFSPPDHRGHGRYGGEGVTVSGPGASVVPAK